MLALPFRARPRPVRNDGMSKAPGAGALTSGAGGPFDVLEGETRSRPWALVVDDDGSIRRMLMDALGTIFEVEGARSGEQALDLLAARSFDLIVTDQMMPGMTGTELLDRSLSLRPDAVRMLITASREIENAMEAINLAKVDRFFVKPVRLAELRQQAVDAVQQRRAERDLRARIESLRSIEARQAAVLPRILVVDDDDGAVTIFQTILEEAGYEVVVEQTGRGALDQLGSRQFNLLLMDKNLPDISGIEVMRLARSMHPDIEAVVVTAYASTESAIEAIEAGAYDYLRKPLEDIEVLPRIVHRALERQALGRERQRLLMDLIETNQVLTSTNEELREAQSRLRRKMEEMDLLQDATVMGLTRLAEYRDLETGEHLERMRNYARLIAEELLGTALFPDVDEAFVEAIYKAAPLHDIGKVGIPDRILLKPGKLTTDEWTVMRTHPTVGGETLEEAERRAGPGSPTGLLTMGKHIAFFHHERWDGSGYPFGRKAEEIPLEARIVAVADAYDAITSRRVYKPSIPHARARSILLEASAKHFDPRIVEAFLAREKDVLAVKAEWAGNEVDLA